MAWSPQSPVRASHGQKSLSFELSPEISQAVGAPIVGYGLTTSPDYHGLLHSPHDYDMTEKVKAKKQQTIVEEIEVYDNKLSSNSTSPKVNC